ncbi:hypothetical protein NDU88_005319 [Pleurodeles waltl]|uniref:Uncharacterized protein n=1 Tax=Pleurodeles waltl TaxID=8319 RepID=A0AAV7LP79_PLEWA|nr:hypothetical protein NDU88_005319 [Pleurodeles waltl]
MLHPGPRKVEPSARSGWWAALLCGGHWTEDGCPGWGTRWVPADRPHAGDPGLDLLRRHERPWLRGASIWTQHQCPIGLAGRVVEEAL